MKTVVLTLVFGFIGFASFGSEYNQPAIENDIVQSIKGYEESEVNSTDIELVIAVNELSHVQPFDFSCMLLSCGQNVCWQDTDTSDDDIVFWWYIYDWIYC